VLADDAGDNVDASAGTGSNNYPDRTCGIRLRARDARDGGERDGTGGEMQKLSAVKPHCILLKVCYGTLGPRWQLSNKITTIAGVHLRGVPLGRSPYLAAQEAACGPSRPTAILRVLAANIGMQLCDDNAMF
jgi:hypothetical protein